MRGKEQRNSVYSDYQHQLRLRGTKRFGYGVQRDVHDRGIHCRQQLSGDQQIKAAPAEGLRTGTYRHLGAPLLKEGHNSRRNRCAGAACTKVDCSAEVGNVIYPTF